MKKFIGLLGFEMDRFLKFLVPTLLISAAVQLFVTFTNIFSYNNEVKEARSTGQLMANMHRFDIHYVTQSSLYELAILLIVLLFVFYSFFTWYREWFGKNTFIYRLLMLPMNRSTIMLSKSLVFLIGGILAFVFQFAMYFVQLQLASWLVESGFYEAVSIHNVQPLYGLIQEVLFPEYGFEFLSRYSFAFAALISLFTAIIIERSYNLKGLIFGGIYFIGYFALYSLLYGMFQSSTSLIDLRPSQIALALLAYQLLTIVVGYIISHFLLKNKIKI